MSGKASTRTQSVQVKEKTAKYSDVIEKGGKFEPEKGRYNLYACLGCPWAQRVSIMLELKGLKDFIGVSIVHPQMLDGGWHFVTPANAKKPSLPASAHSYDSFPGATDDKLYGSAYLSDVYHKADPTTTAGHSVPLLWDTKTCTAVNNESGEILHFLNTCFNDLLHGKEKDLDLCPKDLEKEMHELNDFIMDDVNMGVYHAGTAIKQKLYDEAVKDVEVAMRALEERLDDGRTFLLGERMTEADIRLYTTLIRFDSVYHGHFKCSFGTIRHDFPRLHLWLRRLYWNHTAFKNTTDFDSLKELYYYSSGDINPTRIVAVGPKPDIERLGQHEM